ncbi:LysR family transcriptional regulator [Streptomyces sp. NPDC001193]
MHGLDPRLLATLEAVVRHGSFSAAARELGYSAPAVSQQIAELERRAGLRVLERRPVRVTPAGEVLLGAEQGVRSTLAAASVELGAMRAGTAGRIRLGAFASAATGIVPQALARLHAAYRCSGRRSSCPWGPCLPLTARQGCPARRGRGPRVAARRGRVGSCWVPPLMSWWMRAAPDFGETGAARFAFSGG